jgi:hypothetical protein
MPVSRRSNFFSVSIIFGGVFSLFVLFFYSCSFDSGILEPGPRPLGDFHGVVEGGIKTTYKSPRLAVMWLSIYGGTSLWEIGAAKIDTSVPGRASFTGTFSHFPDDSIVNSDEFILGGLWLYDDSNGNGRLDWNPPAEYSNTLKAIRQVKTSLLADRKTLLNYADTDSVAVASPDTFLIRTGRLFSTGSTSAEISNTDSSGKVWDWKTLLGARFRVLFRPNKWERFFNPDGKLSSGDFLYTNNGLDTLVTACQLRRYRVRAASKGDFAQALEKATLHEALLDSLTKLAQTQISAFWRDNRSNSLSENILGRSDEDYITYFQSGMPLQAIQEAEKASAFSFSKKDGLGVGFNLIVCTKDGNCASKQWDAGVVVKDYVAPVFSLPGTAILLSFDGIKTKVDSSISLSIYQNKYDCACDDRKALTLVSPTNTELGLCSAAYGTFKLTTIDSASFSYSTDTLSMRIRFVLLSKATESIPTKYKLLMDVADRRTSHPDSMRYYATPSEASGFDFEPSLNAFPDTGRESFR